MEGGAVLETCSISHVFVESPDQGSGSNTNIDEVRGYVIDQVYDGARRD